MSDTPRTDTALRQCNQFTPNIGIADLRIMHDLAAQLERELTEALENLEEVKRQNQLFRNESLICADCDAIKKQAYDKAIKQRDTLAEALQLFPEGLHSADERGPCLCSHCEAVRAREKALAAVKGGEG